MNTGQQIMSFLQLSDLEQHQIVHSGIEVFQCTLCMKSFPVRSDLEEHIMKAHKTEKDYLCAVCGKRLWNFISIFV